MLVTFQSLLVSLVASFRMHLACFFRPKCPILLGHDSLDDGHMTAEVHRILGGELVHLVAVHGRLTPDRRRQCGHMMGAIF